MWECLCLFQSMCLGGSMCVRVCFGLCVYEPLCVGMVVFRHWKSCEITMLNFLSCIFCNPHFIPHVLLSLREDLYRYIKAQVFYMQVVQVSHSFVSRHATAIYRVIKNSPSRHEMKNPLRKLNIAFSNTYIMYCSGYYLEIFVHYNTLFMSLWLKL